MISPLRAGFFMPWLSLADTLRGTLPKIGEKIGQCIGQIICILMNIPLLSAV